MIELLVGTLVGALGAWFLMRRQASPSPYIPAAPTRHDRAEEPRITLPTSEVAEPSDSAADTTGATMPPTEPEAAEGITAYCVRCKTQRPMTKVESYTTANGRAALKGTCPVCGAGLFKFVKE